MISTEYPQKKIPRLKSPFQSSQYVDSQYADSRNYNHNIIKNYEEKKFPNVFQFNDRSRVMISDSDLASSINNDSGQNIYNFSPYKKQEQKVQQIESSGHYSSHFYQQKDRFSFNPSQKFQNINFETYQLDKNYEKQKSTKQNQQENQIFTSPQQSKIPNKNYSNPEVNMFTISEKPSETSVTNYQQSQQKVISFKGENFRKQSTTTSKQMKKTFKPKFFQQFQQQQIQFQQDVVELKPQIQKQQQKPIGSNQKYQNLYSKQNYSVKPPFKNHQNQFNEQVEEQKIDIFQSPKNPYQSVLVKEKQNLKILKEEKMTLSAGSQVHSQTENILNTLRNQINLPNEQLQLNQQSHMNSGRFQKANHHFNKDIVESKIYQQESLNTNYTRNLDSKNSTTKKPRKKIFESKTQKSTNDRKSFYQNNQPYVSQFDRMGHTKHRDPSPSQILMKSLNIIDKMANKKAENQTKNVNYQNKMTMPSKTINAHSNLYQPTNEQLILQKQILELNFQISSFETTFDLQNFDSKQQINKLKMINQASVELFEKFKTMIVNHRLVNNQNVLHTELKRQILLIRESAAKLLNFQQKYIQTKNILSSFQEEIKTILLLDSKQKYKKIKLLNEAIQVMQKTQTYLGLQMGKIPVILKSYIQKQKLLLEQLRDWLKQCIVKQNSL